MKTRNLEQVKKHFKYAKEVRCVNKGEIIDITTANAQGFYSNSHKNIQVNGETDGAGWKWNCLLYRIATNQLAEILTYVFDRGEEVQVTDCIDDWGKYKNAKFLTFDFDGRAIVSFDSGAIEPFNHIRKLTPESLLEPQLSELKNKAKEMNCTITVIFENK